MAAFVSIYLTIGLLIGGAMAYAIHQAVGMRGERADVDAVIDRLEGTFSRTPGGVVASLIVVALFWPLAVVFLIRDAAKGWGR